MNKSDCTTPLVLESMSTSTPPLHTAEDFKLRIRVSAEARIEEIARGIKYWMSLSDKDFETVILESGEKRGEFAYFLAYEQEALGTNQLEKRMEEMPKSAV